MACNRLDDCLHIQMTSWTYTNKWSNEKLILGLRILGSQTFTNLLENILIQTPTKLEVSWKLLTCFQKHLLQFQLDCLVGLHTKHAIEWKDELSPAWITGICFVSNLLRPIFSGFGCDTGAVINILAHRDATQRSLIQQEYKAMYSEDILKRLESELSGKLEVAILNPSKPQRLT